MTKRWYKSRTILINIATLTVGVIGYVAGNEVIADNTSVVAMLVALQGGVNIILRLLTWKAIG